MSLTPGTRIGPYAITAACGSGGMGHVYRARDTRLGRDVAIKVLREDVVADAERLKRFEQEARSASALNHPNIVTIHDIGKHRDIPYIAMEWIVGRTLREVLSLGRLPSRRLIDLAIQMGEGLARAHAAGIVHRDFKPENVMVTDDGLVKILDFGLAKLAPQQSELDSRLPTAEVKTRSGIIVGTFGYMSPEQAGGRPALDHRSDQFALGLVLYEMVTGRRDFRRDAAAQTLAAIIEAEA